MYELASDVYRLRPLSEAPLDLKKLEYRNARERIAHDLIARKGAVRIVSENRIYDAGLELTHLNLNDQTVEGFRHREHPAFAVQYHPEASPGPHDSRYLFARFRELITASR